MPGAAPLNAATDSPGDMPVAHAPELAGLLLTYGDGTGLARFDESGRLTQLSMRPVWSPDSTRLVFTQSPPQGGGVEQDKLVLVQAD